MAPEEAYRLYHQGWQPSFQVHNAAYMQHLHGLSSSTVENKFGLEAPPPVDSHPGHEPNSLERDRNTSQAYLSEDYPHNDEEIEFKEYSPHLPTQPRSGEVDNDRNTLQAYYTEVYNRNDDEIEFEEYSPHPRTQPRSDKVCDKISPPQATSSRPSRMSGEVEVPWRPYKDTCTICGRRTTSPKDARRHKRIHTNERTFECTEQDRSFFNRKDHLSRHLQKIHGYNKEEVAAYMLEQGYSKPKM